MSNIYSITKKIGYKVLAWATQGRGMTATINDFKLKLPAKYFRLFPPDYERPSFVFFRKHKNRKGAILDIGAHIGVYSVFFAKTSGNPVFSFEPTRDTAAVLRDTIAMNGLNSQVTVIDAAVSEKPGKATFYANDVEVSTSNSLLDVDLGPGSNRKGAYEVDLVSIDDFRNKHNLKISFLKIDAEGVELEALKGARKTFAEDKPPAILGLHPFAYSDRRSRLSEIWDLIRSYDLQVFENGETIDKENFCSKNDMVFDVELIPA